MADDADIVARAEAQLKDAEAAAVAAQARADAAQADAAVAAQRAKEMRVVWEWLRTQSESPSPAESSGSAQELAAMRFGRPVPETANTDLCFRALETFGRPATTREIRDRVVQAGHDLEVGQVRGAMRYLARKSTSPVETTPGSGLWRLRDAQQAGPVQPGSPAVLPAANGAGGRP
jgi:hypothetical protein